jgi:hypothetical protein
VLTAIDRQYPTDQDKQRLAREILNQVLELADEAVELAGELAAQAKAADLDRAAVYMLERVPLRVRLAREAAQRRDWDDMNGRLDSIQADATHGIEDSPLIRLAEGQRYLDKVRELASAQGRLNQDIATPDLRNLDEYEDADRDELRHARSEAGYPSGRRLIEWA